MLRSPIQACVLWTETNLPFSHLVHAQRVYYQCSIYRDLSSQRLRPHSCVRDPCRMGLQAIWSQGQLLVNRRRVSNSTTLKHHQYQLCERQPATFSLMTFCEFSMTLYLFVLIFIFYIYRNCKRLNNGFTFDIFGTFYSSKSMK